MSNREYRMLNVEGKTRDWLKGNFCSQLPLASASGFLC